MKNQIVVLCGFSASGKDTLARVLEKCQYNFVVSTTTRPMRDNESEGNPYKFTSNNKFESLIAKKELIEYREYNTTVNNVSAKWYYGVTNDAIKDDKQYCVVLDIVGLREFKEHFGDRVVSFFIDCADDIRKQRCIDRGDYDEAEFNRRLLDDKQCFTPDIIREEVDYVITSSDITSNLIEVLTILEEK